MLEALYPFPNDVYLRESDHTYWSHSTGRQYMSVSSVLDMYETPFNSQMMSRASAKKQLTLTGQTADHDSVEVAAQQLRQDWKQNGQEAADRGTVFHKAMEIYLGKGIITQPQWDKQIRALATAVFKNYYRTYSEVICYSQCGVAGTMDNGSEHSSRSRKIIHISDFKTNKDKPQPVLKYGWMKGILSHLPQNKFNRYAMQKSLYGSMLCEYGFEIATMQIVWIDMIRLDAGELMFWELIPVPFMKHEADAVLQEARLIQIN